jgi:transcriptional regulator with XRE-family HTH domain
MRLDQYLSHIGVSDAEFGARIGRSRSAISRLRRGKTTPDWNTVSRIVVATNGAVTANDFLPEQASQEAPQPIS